MVGVIPALQAPFRPGMFCGRETQGGCPYYRAAPPGHQAEPDGGEPDAGPNDEERGEAPVPNQTPLARSSSSVSFTLEGLRGFSAELSQWMSVCGRLLGQCPD